MSPRSTEFLHAARERLTLARSGVDSAPGAVVSLVYYAMLLAARAALSERDLYAKTHGGTWHLFHETFVKTGEFDPHLAAAAHDRQRQREQADYEARTTSREDAVQLVELGERFVGSVEAMFA